MLVELQPIDDMIHVDVIAGAEQENHSGRGPLGTAWRRMAWGGPHAWVSISDRMRRGAWPQPHSPSQLSLPSLELPLGVTVMVSSVQPPAGADLPPVTASSWSFSKVLNFALSRRSNFSNRFM